MNSHSVLTDPTFTVAFKSGDEQKCSLAQVYAEALNDSIQSFVHLQTFQVQGWHTFLAQLAAMAIDQHGDEIPETAAAWEELLLQMGPPEMWNVETEDLSKPAFCQAPVPDPSVIAPKREADVWQNNILVQTKSHKNKSSVLHNPNQEHYLYWAVNTQQSSKFSGRGSASTSRMNGGFSSRSFLGVTPSLSFGAWVMHDVQALMNAQSDVAYEYSFVDTRGKTLAYSPEDCLLWLTPQPEEPRHYTECHPYYLDAPRRLRQVDGTWYQFIAANSNGTTASENGITGDPWAPRQADGALSASANTKGYKQLAEILTSEDWVRPAVFTSTEVEGYVVLRVTTGGQGKREHLIERIIPYSFDASKSVSDLFASSDEDDTTPATEKTQQRLELAGRAESGLKQVFYYLYSRTLDGSTEYAKSAQALNRQVKDQLHQQIDTIFFEELYTSGRSKEEDRLYFLSLLRPIFKEVTDQMISGPITSQAWKRKAGAEGKQSLYLNHYLAD